MSGLTQSDREILRERARALGRRQEAPPQNNTLEVLEFGLARERYAIEMRHVQEVISLKEVTHLPCTPAFVVGIINVRGQILPVYDLQRLLELPQCGLTDLHEVILVRGDDLEFGLLADVVAGIRLIPAERLQSSLPTLGGLHADFLKGVTDEGLVVLAMSRILADPRLIVDEEPAC